MSKFLGIIDEIPGISVDYFEDETSNCTVFFLSHCHHDHMKGLSRHFFTNLARNEKFFYCSHFTKAYLKSAFHLSDLDTSNIIELRLNDPLIVNYFYQVQVSITVTSISAGHCPGSLMFLFLLNDGKNILYTGDFRINIADLANIKSLHTKGTCPIPKVIDKVYLDTTFLNPDYKVFPKRSESSKKMCTIIKNWLDKNANNIVIIKISATYGSEFLFMDIYKSLNVKIHVCESVYSIYKKVEGLSQCITIDGNSTNVHACTKKSSKTFTCRKVESKNLLTINPSVIRWRGKDTTTIIEWDSHKFQTVHICYATHSSFEELKNFINYFKLKDIHACVYEKDYKEQMYNLLNSIMLGKKTEQTQKISLTLNKKVKKFKRNLSSDED